MSVEKQDARAHRRAIKTRDRIGLECPIAVVAHSRALTDAIHGYPDCAIRPGGECNCPVTRGIVQLLLQVVADRCPCPTTQHLAAKPDTSRAVLCESCPETCRVALALAPAAALKSIMDDHA